MTDINRLLAELRENYLANFKSQTDEIEHFILKLETADEPGEAYDGLYRKIHSIKGSAGTHGLSILSSICHQMEDYISAHVYRDQVNQSATINVLFQYLDLLAETGEALVNHQADVSVFETKLESIGKSIRRSKKRCLCVGLENTVHQQIINEVIKSLPIEISYVSSGLVALERLFHETFDIIITNKEIQDMNGLALLTAVLLNEGKNAKATSILTTSNPSLKVPKEFLPNFVITKNRHFTDDLVHALNTALNQ